jgi:hypothetical protein
LLAIAVCPATEVQRMYRPLREQVRPREWQSAWNLPRPLDNAALKPKTCRSCRAAEGCDAVCQMNLNRSLRQRLHGFCVRSGIRQPRTLLERGLPANAMLHAKKMGWMYWPLRGQVRSHGIGDLSGKRITLWEGACSRLRYVRPQRGSGCTDLFANKFAPTGSVICPVNASRCGRELARDCGMSGYREAADVPPLCADKSVLTGTHRGHLCLFNGNRLATIQAVALFSIHSMASAPAARRIGVAGSFAARHTASATSFASVTTVACAHSLITCCASSA